MNPEDYMVMPATGDRIDGWGRYEHLEIGKCRCEWYTT